MTTEAIMVPLTYVVGIATPLIGSLCAALVALWKFYTDKASAAAERHAAELAAARAETARVHAEAESRVEKARVEYAHERESLLRAVAERDERRLAEQREAFERERRLREEHLRDVRQTADALALQAETVDLLREVTTSRR